MSAFKAHVIQVIETDLELRGDGTERNPYRRIRQYWALDGNLIAEVDPFTSLDHLDTGRTQSGHPPLANRLAEPKGTG